jgi:hypothetical protein
MMWVGESGIRRLRYYITGVSKLQQAAYQQEEPERRPLNSELPPNIPDNDVQVQQFLTKPYHSHSEDGTPDPDK